MTQLWVVFLSVAKFSCLSLFLLFLNSEEILDILFLNKPLIFVGITTGFDVGLVGYYISRSATIEAFHVGSVCYFSP